MFSMLNTQYIHFGSPDWDQGVSANGIYWAEARDITKHSAKHRPTPTTKNYVVQNVNSAEVDKPCCTPVLSIHRLFT